MFLLTGEIPFKECKVCVDKQQCGGDACEHIVWDLWFVTLWWYLNKHCIVFKPHPVITVNKHKYGQSLSHSAYELRHPTVAADLAGRCLRSRHPGGNTKRRFVFWRCLRWSPIKQTGAGWALLWVHGWDNQFVPDGLNRSVNTQTGMSSSSCRSFVLLSKSNSGLTVAVNWAVPLRLRAVCLQTTNIPVAALWSVQRSACSAHWGINMSFSLGGLTFMLGFLFHAPSVINRKQKPSLLLKASRLE